MDTSNLQLASKPSVINHKDLKFLIMDRPTEFNLPAYLRELKVRVRLNVGSREVWRCCDWA